MATAIGFFGVCSATIGQSISTEQEQALQPGLTAYRSGNFVAAIQSWSEVIRQAGGDSTLRGHALARRSLAYQALGRFPDKLEDLRASTMIGADACPAEAEVAQLDAFASAYFLSGRPDSARRCLSRALTIAEQNGDVRMRAVILNNEGNLLEAVEQLEDAAAAFATSAELAKSTGERTVEAKALANLAAIWARSPSRPDFSIVWARAQAAAKELPDSHAKSTILTSLGNSGTKAARTATAVALSARIACLEADQIARNLADSRLSINASLCLADLYAMTGQTDIALGLARRALIASADPQLADLGFASHGRMGLYLRTLGRNAEAVDAYRSAVSTLESIRADLALSRHTRSGGFRATVEPVYAGLADLLLRQAQADVSKAQPLLREARRVVELFKAAELRDYFQDDCVDALQARRGAVELADNRAAVLYPIVLPDRVVLLVSFPDGNIVQRAISADRNALASSARELREAIHQPTTADHLKPAKRLYDALLRDLEPELAARRIDTLAVVPDGPLRWIPFAALHDGERYLVARYAIATIPGLDLIDAQRFKPTDATPLLAGLSLAVGDFPALKAVPAELEGIHKVFGGRVLRDQAFTSSALQQELSSRPYSVVHLASHGEFAGDARRSFLVTADGELSMDRLQRLMRLGQFRDTPIELLTLSACETAAGDDRAALGLAGLAMQAGARSALASLWRVHDTTTASLITDFYAKLATPGTSKAQALRLAQLRVIEHPQTQYRHPYFWSPFVLIGNWL